MILCVILLWNMESMTGSLQFIRRTVPNLSCTLFPHSQVRHPYVLDHTYMDAYLIFGSFPIFRALRVPLVAPFSESSFTTILQKQVDFKWEAYHLQRFAHNFRDEAKRGGTSYA